MLLSPSRTSNREKGSPVDLVRTMDYGIRGRHYLRHDPERWGLTVEDLQQVGVQGDWAEVDSSLIGPLRQVNRELAGHGWELEVADGYRSPEVYRLARQAYERTLGKAHTDAILNTDDMPHADGRTVDIQIFVLATGEHIFLRSNQHDPEGKFLNFYRDRQDPQSVELQRRQDIVHDIMLRAGFWFGSKQEIFHFEYRPEVD